MPPRADQAYLWLSPNWAAWLEFGGGNNRDHFVEITERLCKEFGATITERLPDPTDVRGKEYLSLTIDGRPFLLMRGPPPWGTALSGQRGDTEFMIRIGRAFGVQRFRGWRWRLFWACRWVRGQR